jgi:glycosyl transferase family 1
MKVNLISRDNGVGLSKDMALLESVLRPAGHDVARVNWDARSMRRCDVAVFLELFNPALVPYAAKHVGIFNLEWFLPRWKPYMPRFRQLWAKSLEAYEVMRRWGLRNVHHTGFLGQDIHDPAVPRELRCVHLAGHSPLKNTDAVLAAWRAAPDLPPLTVITANAVAGDIPAHVRVVHGYLSADELHRELNAAQIHVCPSAAEGWGHYITEALSVGALVIATDGSPMNEQVRPEHGILVPPSAIGRRHYAAHHHVDPGAIINAVRHAVALGPERREAMGALGRQHLLTRNERFRTTALDLLRRA